MRRGLFITGTDTGVGKTRLAAAIVRRLRSLGIRAGAYKPVASGARFTRSGPVWDDIEILTQALGDDTPRDLIGPQCFVAPLAPPVAAREEGRAVDAALLRAGAAAWGDRAEALIVEGAGGFLSPLTDKESNAELAIDLGFPLVIVARQALGTINHTLLTIEAAQRRGVPVAGVILNRSTPPDPADQSATTNAGELAARAAVPVLAEIPYAPHADLLQVEAFQRMDLVALVDHRR